MANKNYVKGRNFEYRVRNKFLAAGWPYVKRNWGSKGIADIVAIKPVTKFFDPDRSYQYEDYTPCSIVAQIQCKCYFVNASKALSKKDKAELVRYAQDHGAYPIFAYNIGKKIRLVNLSTNKEFIP